MEADSSNNYDDPNWEQAGAHADPQDLAGPGAHGRLECHVSKPQKEGEGTQNAYVSPHIPRYDGASRISCSCIRRWHESIRNVLSRLYQTSTTWHTFAVTDLDPTLPIEELFPCSASLSDLHYILSYGELQYSHCSWKVAIGMPS
ncbi:hypothetical protein KC323_g322 [Hortaea werneckii]|nr:hypothetical protein KC323_g322 [Hortaea werneckii]